MVLSEFRFSFYLVIKKNIFTITIKQIFQALEMKDEEVDELRGIRERLMKEVSDFTASLFEVSFYVS